ncbi:MAG: insulinase family protein [Gammaproteobacteria bacterium]|nr:insulinase family protein [Gammaproteobacteria bacterium]
MTVLSHSSRYLLFGLGLLALAACGDPASAPESSATDTEAGAASLGYTRVNEPNPLDQMDTHIFRLDNGLLVYLTENHEEPRFYAEIAVRAGSKHDPADATGLAHYLEHLLFKGNRNLGSLDYEAEAPHLQRIVELYEEHFATEDPQQRAAIYAEINATAQEAAQYAVPNEIDKLYNSMGATGLNAHTSNEETVYRVGLPSNRLRQWAEIESDRFVNPVFRLFHTELEIVYEEKNRSLDNRGFIIYTALNELLFPVHPYGQQPTIGTVDHLKNPSLVYIQDYFDTWYVPNNMGIFISGDIDIPSTIELIAEKFGHWEPRELPETGPWNDPPLDGERRGTVQYPGEEQVQIAFPTAPYGDPDMEALILVDMILDNRTAGLINLNLNQQQQVAQAGSSPAFLNDAGYQLLWGVPKQDQTLEEVERLLIDQIEIIKSGEFEDWIIAAIVNDFAKNEKAGLESNNARVVRMRDSFIRGVDWDYRVAELDRMSGLTRTDVVEVANRYFGGEFVAVHQVNAQHEVPPVEKPVIDPVEIDPTRQSDFASRILAMEAAPIEPVFVEQDRDYRILDLTEGVQLYYAPNPLNDLFAFSVSVDAGSEENGRLSLAAALMDVAGSASMSNEDLQKEWYRMGSEFGFRVGENSSSFRLTGLDDQFEDSLALMLELVRTPVSDENTLAQLKGIILKSREDQKQSPPAIARALYLYNRYGEESPMLESLTSEEIMQSGLEELLALPAGLLDYEQTIAYTGSLPLEDVAEIVRRHLQPDADLQEPPEYRFRQVREIEETELYVVDQQTAQAQVRIEFADGVYDESDSVLSSLYTSYFGSGMSSVVFQELREARALAYSASARYAQGGRLNDQNLMLGAIGTQTDKTAEALTAFIDLIDNMPVAEERLDEAVNSTLNRYRTSKLSFREVIGAVRAWERLGLEGDPRRQRYAELQQAGMDDLLEFQREHVRDRDKLISIVGDLSVIDVAELEQFGRVQEVQVEDLFVD